MIMRNVLGLIMGGGKGTRLYPLTRDRAKPAVPLAGKYRLIDIPMSNCIHAGIDKIAILTQFNSVSLHRHIYRTFNRDMFSRGWVQILAAEQTPRHEGWYQGTADAVRKQWLEIQEAGTEYILVLAGDHLYRMDYRAFAEFHEASGADVSVAVQPVGAADAPGLGILKLDRDGRIVEFREKPPADKLDGLESNPGSDRPFMGSMGIYFFRTRVLQELLDNDFKDFGGEVIPRAIESRHVAGYRFDGYWEDIGTIDRFFEVNLRMTQPDPPFDFYDAQRPIYSHPRFLPGSEIHGAYLHNVLLGDGCRIYEAQVRNVVVGLRSQVRSGATIHNSILMGADFYETDDSLAENARLGRPPIGIGEGTVIQKAIVDKNARIGRNVHIRHVTNRPDQEHENWVSVDGIVVVPKNAIIPDGTVI